MTRNEFVKLLNEYIEPNAEIDFLVYDNDKPIVAFLDVERVCMNEDVDDPNNYNSGCVVLTIKEDLTINNDKWSEQNESKTNC